MHMCGHRCTHMHVCTHIHGDQKYAHIFMHTCMYPSLTQIHQKIKIYLCLFNVYVCVCVCVCLHEFIYTMHVSADACGSQKRAPEPLELELQAALRHHVGDGN